MGFGSGPSVQPTPAAPPAAAPATLASPQNQAAGANSRARAAAAGANSNGTVGTSPEGLEAAPPTAKATLLGATK